MGYLTSFDLKANPTTPELLHRIVESDPKNNVEWEINNAWDEMGDLSKWYDCEKDMRQFSKEFPAILFTLKGEGEESGDIWIEYYKDGKMQRCEAKITFDVFEEGLLQ